MSTTEHSLRAWRREVARIAAGGAAASDIVASVASQLDPSWSGRGLLLVGDGRPPVPPLPDGSGPEVLGLAYEATLDAVHRRRAGAHFTPPAVAHRLSAIALDALVDDSVSVCDPACGGGAFLLAAGEILAARGFARREIVERRLFGIDTDPLAIAVAEAALHLWSGASPGDHLIVADALADPWPATDLSAVVGNPPFQNQLENATSRGPEAVRRLRARFGSAVGAYTDTAWLFLLAAHRAARPGGRVVLVQPQSVLAARDAAAVRRGLDLEGLWLADEPVFEASVRVCAPVVHVGERPHRKVQRWRGSGVLPMSTVAAPRRGEWAGVAAGILGVPEVELNEGRRVGDLATATAGFRDQFYGLDGFVVDRRDGSLPRLVTCGLIEPGWMAWGERPARFARRRWSSPRVDTPALRADGHASVARWVDDRLVPKLVVATQSSVVETAIDRDGSWVPSTPVVSLVVPPDRLDHTAAALLAPPVTAWALRRFAGAALVTGAVKLAARQVLELPLPDDGGAWDEAAEVVAGALTDGRSGSPEGAPPGGRGDHVPRLPAAGELHRLRLVGGPAPSTGLTGRSGRWFTPEVIKSGPRGSGNLP